MSQILPRSANYRPDIDGLRALAVLAVLFNHAGLGCPGGYVGVDVFFVISGYLITELILKDLDRGSFSLAQFWERRVRRIMPALVAVVLATLIAGWFRLLPQDYRDLGRSVVAQATLASNFYFYTVSGYFEQAASQKPLLHTWSLAVEEQFYLLYPLLLLVVHRWSRRLLVPLMLFLLAVSFALSVAWSYSHAWANFYFLPTRAWELLIGGVIAALPKLSPSSKAWREAGALVGLLAIIYAILCFDRDTHIPGLPALLPCGGAALLIASCRAGGNLTLPLAGRFLALPPWVFIGLISYSLYLWHWPLLVLSQYWEVAPISFGTRCWLLILSIGIAAISWRYVETPFRQRDVLPRRSRLFLGAGATTAALLAMGAFIVAREGIPARLPEAAQRFAAGTEDFSVSTGISLDDALKGRFAELGAGDHTGPVQVLVWGDSHAMAVMPAINDLCRKHGVRGLAATHSATVPLIDYANLNPDSLRGDNQRFNEAVIRYITQHRVRNVLMVARWDGYLEYDHHQLSAMRDGIIATVQALKDSGARLWVMPAVPSYKFNVPKSLAAAVIHGQDTNALGLSLAAYHRMNVLQNEVFTQAKERLSDIAFTLLHPERHLSSPNGRCLVTSEGFSLYRDSHHLSTRGALYLAPLFEPLFAEESSLESRK